LPEFTLRFPLEDLRALASRNARPEDLEVHGAGRNARERGFYTREEFLVVSRWNGVGSRPGRSENGDAAVEEITRTAFASPDERARVETLFGLAGVTWPSASVLLHWGHRDPYPVIEPRVLWSAGIDRVPRRFDFEFWSGYVRACRRTMEQSGVDARTLDRALWQYWAEQRALRAGGKPAEASDPAVPRRSGPS
jgi:hypothetical protein